MIQDNASFTFLHRIADVDRRKSRHLSKVLLGDVSLVAELLKPQRKDVCVELHVKTLQNSSLSCCLLTISEGEWGFELPRRTKKDAIFWCRF